MINRAIDQRGAKKALFCEDIGMKIYLKMIIIQQVHKIHSTIPDRNQFRRREGQNVGQSANIVTGDVQPEPFRYKTISHKHQIDAKRYRPREISSASSKWYLGDHKTQHRWVFDEFSWADVVAATSNRFSTIKTHQMKWIPRSTSSLRPVYSMARSKLS